MNEMNLPESQLRSWRPRHPSPGLKPRIFAAEPGRSAAEWFLGSLAPVAACALLTLLMFNSGNGFPAGSGSGSGMADMILSNQSYAAYASDNSSYDQNRLATVIFDSTNLGASTSTIRFTPFTKPND